MMDCFSFVTLQQLYGKAPMSDFMVRLIADCCLLTADEVGNGLMATGNQIADSA
jgi:hypothetical protein